MTRPSRPFFPRPPLLTPEHLAVITAARDYIREVENPVPDYVYRRMLRDRLRAALDVLDGRALNAARREEGQS